MRKAKTNFTTASNTSSMLAKYDFSHKGFAVVHEERNIYVLESTDAEIRRGNEFFMDKFLSLTAQYPNYTCSILHIVFLR